MLGTLTKFALLRFLPRRLIPLLTAWQIVQMLRGRGETARRQPPTGRR